MASIFGRIFKIGQSQAHAAIDQLEDPIRMTEQGIRDLKKNLHEAMTGLAEVKAVALRLKKDSDDQTRSAGEYERKAMLLLQKMQSGELDAAQAENLASQALARKEDAAQRGAALSVDHQTQQQAADGMQVKVERLRRDIGRYENELVTLRARARTAASMQKVNRQLAGVDSSSTIAMLEKMKDRVAADESLAAAYGELGQADASLDDQLDLALAAPPAGSGSDSLAALKAKMGIES